MRTNHIVALSNGLPGPRVFGVGLAALVMLAATNRILAEPTFMIAREDGETPGFFSLSFEGIGVPASAEITRTEIVLQLDCTDQTTQFLDYQQDVGSITLPGGFSTGAIHVSLASTRNGECDEDAGEFVTDHDYAIGFSGDLSAFGLFSPVNLPGISIGTIAYDSQVTGTIEMEWEGVGALPNPFIPGEFLNFRYTCSVISLFRIPGPGDLDGDVDVDLRDVAFMQNCFSGEEDHKGGRCHLLNQNGNVGVDLEDAYAALQYFSGPE
jgi:hypothetical protein